MATAITSSATRKWLLRIGWLAAIWLASVSALFVLAAAFRFLMAAAGLSS